MLGCPCFQLRAEVGVNDRGLWGFPSASFAQRPGVTNSCSLRLWCPGDNRSWPVTKALCLFSLLLWLSLAAGSGSLPLWQCETRCIAGGSAELTPVSCQCLAVISFLKDFSYMLGILIFPSHCFASYRFRGKERGKKKGAKALLGNRILMRRLRKARGGGSLCSCSTKDREYWGRNVNVYDEEGGGRGESYLKSQLGNHSSSLRGHSKINFQFQFPCLLCFKTLTCHWRWGICQQLFV